jgi:DNA modification methylase
VAVTQIASNYFEKMSALLTSDLDYSSRVINNPLHNYHSFPAKFPPELPRSFILELTSPKDIVLDPMLGSGTTILEAFLNNRHAVGCDIDPLALLMSKVKTSSPNLEELYQYGLKVLAKAKVLLEEEQSNIETNLKNRWDDRTKAFVDYWFLPQTQLELQALSQAIEEISETGVKEFFQLAFSSIIITKSGGVSLALDLGHTRPHRVKPILNETDEQPENKSKRIHSAIKAFEKRFNTNLNALRMRESLNVDCPPQVHYSYAQDLPLRDNSVDLIVTSPPYASNAIDYMRAHKFSLVWLGYTIDELSKQKTEYIGNEKVKDSIEMLTAYSDAVITDIATVDVVKSKILRSYFNEMKLVISEMFRVLKPGKGAIVVVGNSTFRGKDTCTGQCLADIGKSIGFLVPGIKIRNIDRNRRMMPVGNKVDLNSQVQQRMHQEYVIGFYKPC